MSREPLPIRAEAKLLTTRRSGDLSAIAERPAAGTVLPLELPTCTLHPTLPARSATAAPSSVPYRWRDPVQPNREAGPQTSPRLLIVRTLPRYHLPVFFDLKNACHSQLSLPQSTKQWLNRVAWRPLHLSGRKLTDVSQLRPGRAGGGAATTVAVAKLARDHPASPRFATDRWRSEPRWLR